MINPNTCKQTNIIRARKMMPGCWNSNQVKQLGTMYFIHYKRINHSSWLIMNSEYFRDSELSGIHYYLHKYLNDNC